MLSRLVTIIVVAVPLLGAAASVLSVAHVGSQGSSNNGLQFSSVAHADPASRRDPCAAISLETLGLVDGACDDL